MPELLSGCVEVESGASTKQEVIDNRQTLNRVFPSGLLRHILDYLRTYLLKDTWKKSPLACHVLVWCTMQVKVNCTMEALFVTTLVSDQLNGQPLVDDFNLFLPLVAHFSRSLSMRISRSADKLGHLHVCVIFSS